MTLSIACIQMEVETNAEICLCCIVQTHSFILRSGNKINTITQSLLSLSVFFPHFLLLLTFSPNNAASLIAAVLLSFFSDVTIHMNVNMEQLTLGCKTVLKEDLPAAASDME